MFKRLACLAALCLVGCSGGNETSGPAATHYDLRFEPKDASRAAKRIDVRLGFRGGTLQAGKVPATVLQSDGVTKTVEVQVDALGNGLVLRPWPVAADTGYSILFTPPEDLDAPRWPDGTMLVTSDVGDEDAGAVAIGRRP